MASDDDARGAKLASPVGYGRPPVERRFKPGQSGNPKGRPRGSKNLNTLVEQELDRPIVIRDGGRTRSISKREAIALRLVANGVKGEQRALETLLKLERANSRPEPVDYSSDSDADFRDYMDRLAAARQKGPEDVQAETVVAASTPDDDVPE